MKRKMVFGLSIVILIFFLSGCLYYNPLVDSGDTYDRNIIKNVIQWFRYYVMNEDINGLMTLIYPYSPYFDKIRDTYNGIFSTCDSIRWEYDIEHIFLEDNNMAEVIGSYVLSATCGDVRGELYIQMKKSNEGIWFIYNVDTLIPATDGGQ